MTEVVDSISSNDNNGITTINIKWNGSVYPLSAYDEMTVGQFKAVVQNHTNVRPDNQKLVNLRYKGNVTFLHALLYLIVLFKGSGFINIVS